MGPAVHHDAAVDAHPTYVSALGQADAAGGWRAAKARGGCWISASDGQIRRRRLVPHSPRWHQDKLCLLESGTAMLLHLDPPSGQNPKVAAFPGFARPQDAPGSTLAHFSFGVISDATAHFQLAVITNLLARRIAVPAYGLRASGRPSMFRSQRGSPTQPRA